VLQKDPKAWPIRGVLAGNYMYLANLLRRTGDDKAATEADRQAQGLRPAR
jgi:hypothetical protein